MRGNSLAPRKPVFRPLVVQKSNPSTRPPTRGTSFQPRSTKVTTKSKDIELRLKKCPNCGSSFSPFQYNIHFRSCFRYNIEREEKNNFSKTTKQSFRIKKLKANKQDTIQKRNPQKEITKQIQKQQEQRFKEEQKIQLQNKEDLYQTLNPQTEIKREIEQKITNEIEKQKEQRNIQQIEIVQSVARQEHQIIPPTQQQNYPAVTVQRTERPLNRPPTPYPRTLLQQDLSISSSSSNSSRQNVNSFQSNPSNRRHQNNSNSFQNMIDEIGVNQISALINRLPFLRQNPIVQQRLQNLVSFIGIINLMIPSQQFSMNDYPGIKNILQSLVQQLTQVLTMIVSARLGMVLLMIPHTQPQVQGFSQQQIDRLFIPQIHTTGNQTCTVCLNDFIKFQRTMSLKCKHEFHMNCITEWLLKSTKCPVCRSDQKQ